MGWLKTIALDALKILPVLVGLGPIFGQLIPNSSGGAIVQRVLGDLNSIPQIILTVEAMVQGEAGQKMGSQKLAVAAPYVGQLIEEYAKSNLPGSPKVKDRAKFETAVVGITSNMADAMNAFGG
jgi:hypothetical protein